MMSAFSIGAAVKSGFGVIRRNPGAVVVWTLVYLVLACWPYAVIVPLLGLEFWINGGMGEKPRFAALLIIQLVQTLSFLTSTLGLVLLFCAIYRAVLEPNQKRRWFMRLGTQELWVGLVSTVMFVLLVIAACVLAMPLAAVWLAFAIADTAPSPIEIGVLCIIGALLFAVLLWVWTRLSLAVPMSFERRAFILFESWSLTRGHALRMFLAYLAAYFLICLAGFLLLLAFAAVAMLLSLPFGGPGTLGAIFQSPGQIGGLMLLTVVMAGLITAMSHTVMLAPGAYIYRQLTARPATAPGT
jgi:hypothetical protein